MSNELTRDELAHIGAQLVTLAGASMALGHVSVAGTLDYTERGDNEWSRFVWDVIAATRTDAPEANVNVHAFLRRHNVAAKIAAAVVR